MDKKVALITGITGQDGSYLAEFLIEKGYEVHGTLRRSSSFNTGRIEHLYLDEWVRDMKKTRLVNLHWADMTDSSSLVRIISEIKPSEIYNLYSSKTLGVGVPWNNSGYYQNDKVDEYIDKALQSEDEDSALEYWKKAQWDGETGFSHMGDCAYTWFVNAGQLYLADEELDIGTPVVQPHGGKVLYNITEWSWK